MSRLRTILVASLLAASCGSAQPSSQPTQPVASAQPLASASPAAGELKPDPNAPAYALRDPRAPARLDGQIHDLNLAFHERFITVAEGFVQAVWTIGGTVPGPVIRVQARDAIRVHLVNRPPKGSGPAAHPPANHYPHGVEFDGSTDTSPEQWQPLGLGEERVLEFTTERAGVWMYHGNTEPVLQSIANGMYGLLIVEPEGGLETVGQEFFFVQSEWYVHRVYPPMPPLPSLAKASAASPDPDFVALNGVAGQYVDNPIRVAGGERIRAFILNAGPNLDMAFRVEGAVLERVIREGIELDVGAEDWASGSVLLVPGQGAIVEFTLADDGTFPIVSDASNIAERGPLGAIHVGDAAP